MELCRTPGMDYLSRAFPEPPLPLLKSRLPAMRQDDNDEGFRGGLMGWIAYDAGCLQKNKAAAFPGLCLGGYDMYIREDREGNAVLHADNPDIAARLLDRLATLPDPAPFRLDSGFGNLTSKARYQEAFRQIQDYLHAGDCYQINFAQAFRARCHGDSLEAFELLNSLGTPPHAAYICSPEGDALSLSPELFLAFDGGHVLTRPIKGTRPRGKTPSEDAALITDLREHPKDRAENLMIVDLLRHDLGKHALTGSVQAAPLFRIESFPHVHHLVSDVRCRLRPDSHPLDLLFDAFPGGSITGAPKKRAMEIIAELENHPRSIYCGSIGYLNADGNGEWNIAIRTLLRTGNDLFAWAGGGIVADSDCEDEYQECFNKIGPLLAALETHFLD